MEYKIFQKTYILSQNYWSFKKRMKITWETFFQFMLMISFTVPINFNGKVKVSINNTTILLYYWKTKLLHASYRKDIVIRARDTLHATTSSHFRKLQLELSQIKSAIKDDVYLKNNGRRMRKIDVGISSWCLQDNPASKERKREKGKIE